MSDDIVIHAEGLSKRYIIGREGKRERYVALRDVIARTAKNASRKICDTLSGREIVAGDSVEEFWALKNIDFEVRRGEVMGVIGRNGAGKSTLLKILSRITEPSAGRVTIRGRVASLLEVGTGFHPELTGRENIYLNGAVLGMARAEIRRKFDEIVAFAEVDRFLDTPVKRYSSGMYVRLAFAVAAHLEPEILVVDEVLAVGDAEFQRKCLGKMGEVATGGRTVLFVSHNMSAIRSLCRMGILLASGRIQEIGSSADVTNLYLRQVTASTALAVVTDNMRRTEGLGGSVLVVGVIVNHGKPVFHGQTFSFAIRFRSNQKHSDLAFHVAFCSPDGTRVMCIDSDIPGRRFKLEQGANEEVVLTVDALHLEPSTYSINVGVRSGDNFMLDHLQNLTSVTVLPSAETPAVIAMRRGGQCEVRYPCSTVMTACSHVQLN
jgi:lipopolysaccharide transport system ATP-binding protein